MFNLLFSNYLEPLPHPNDLIIIAIHNENTYIIESLINRQSQSFVWGEHLMHHAASQSSLDVFNLIVSIKYKPAIDVNLDIKDDSETSYLTERDENGEIPLHWGVMKGDHRVVKKLIELMLNSGLSIDIKAMVSDIITLYSIYILSLCIKRTALLLFIYHVLSKTKN